MAGSHITRKPQLWAGIGLAAIILVAGLTWALRPRLGSPGESLLSPALATTVVPVAPVAAATSDQPPMPLPSARPSPTPTALPASPTPVACDRLAPAAGRLVFDLTPEAAGWASDLDGRVHLDQPNIHVGFYRGHVYIGVLQFDLSSIPPYAIITDAALELTGRDAQRLKPNAAWQARLLATDMAWPPLSFDALAETPADMPVAPPLAATDLGRGRVNVLVFEPAGLAALREHASLGQIAFRLDGPAHGEDNLFTWDSGQAAAEGSPTEPRLRIIAARATPTPTATFVIITSTPTPKNVVTVAALLRAATAAASRPDFAGSPTPLPANWVTPVIVRNTPTPANAATATFAVEVATAWAFVYGTPTSLPPNAWTATPAPADVLAPEPLAGPEDEENEEPLLIALEQLTPTPTPSLPRTMPAVLAGKIAFYSDRLGEPALFVMDSEGRNVALLTRLWPYDLALEREAVAPDGLRQAFVRENARAKPQIFFFDSRYRVAVEVTRLTGAAYDPAWSPTDDRIAFVSGEPGNDEIYVIGADGSGLRRLTSNQWEWDKHPSWSPDGRQIVFYSNRETGRRQIWIMDADGSRPRNLSNNAHEEWNPVWIK